MLSNTLNAHNGLMLELEGKHGVFGMVRIIRDIHSGVNTTQICNKYEISKYEVNSIRNHPELALTYTLHFHDRLKNAALFEMNQSKITTIDFRKAVNQ